VSGTFFSRHAPPQSPKVKFSPDDLAFKAGRFRVRNLAVRSIREDDPYSGFISGVSRITLSNGILEGLPHYPLHGHNQIDRFGRVRLEEPSDFFIRCCALGILDLHFESDRVNKHSCGCAVHYLYQWLRSTCWISFFVGEVGYIKFNWKFNSGIALILTSFQPVK